MFEWTEEAEEAFVQLKNYLRTLPRLVSPLKDEKLYMYLAISNHSLSSVLLAERDDHQIPVYFISHILHNAELRYPPIEKFSLALFMALKKLRPYFLARSIVVYTDQQLKKPFITLEASGRMLKWALELSGFDITFEPRKAIKGQALVDFLAKMTRPDLQPAKDQIWKVFVDGSATTNGCGAGIICQSTEGEKFIYALRFQFQASNNEAEYEVLLAGLRMCKAVEATKIDASSDSQLIVSQVNGDYEAREPTMMKYLQMVKDEADSLEHFTLQASSPVRESSGGRPLQASFLGICNTPRFVFWEVKEKRSIDAEPVKIIDGSSTWMDGVISYLKDGVLPDDPKESWLMKKKKAWFEMKGENLFKKSFVKPYLKCITAERGHEVLDDLHQGH
ncbi:uncharacterized protein LOC110738521 [Chenopodium quinoa]|uniref:uncharacterized protein LOC110738521 n=1 Tax=Chenopodium quinoa TaxID=63459 RepID=UPI000B77CB66|nr:uncharacterized protein LOC110738521 [Chenopodium quinoa]